MPSGWSGRHPTSLYGLPLGDQPVALVLGSEGSGLAPLSRKRCSELAAIPQHGTLSSLNVATAGAIACFDVARQRAAARHLTAAGPTGGACGEARGRRRRSRGDVRGSARTRRRCRRLKVSSTVESGRLEFVAQRVEENSVLISVSISSPAANVTSRSRSATCTRQSSSEHSHISMRCSDSFQRATWVKRSGTKSAPRAPLSTWSTLRLNSAVTPAASS